MKKQILVLLLALFAGISVAYGQAIQGSFPRPLVCETSPLNPIAGVPYDYAATLNPALGIAYWYATTSTTFMTAGARVATEELIGGNYVTAATNYRDSLTVATSPSTTNITWNSVGLANHTGNLPLAPAELFVVVEYTAPAAGCANNMKVYPIRPINAFTVDIMNMNPTTQVPSGYGTLEEQCYDGVQSAVYVPASNMMDYDFGTNVMYFEVIAANFTDFFTPSFQISGLMNGQTALLEYGVAVGSYGLFSELIVNGTPLSGSAVSTAVTNTSEGVSIYVRVTITNGDYEGLSIDGDAITLAVDALNSAVPPQPDVDNDDCTVVTAYSDFATQNLKARPTVLPVAPNTFIPQIVAP
ncbi:MAG: hypothetical protein Q8M23_08980 [Bacteroidales bacterium]|nr:hypothetical protein [Bacteroidales bacterium]